MRHVPRIFSRALVIPGILEPGLFSLAPSPSPSPSPSSSPARLFLSFFFFLFFFFFFFSFKQNAAARRRKLNAYLFPRLFYALVRPKRQFTRSSSNGAVNYDDVILHTLERNSPNVLGLRAITARCKGSSEALLRGLIERVSK